MPLVQTYLLKLVHWVQTSKTLSKVRSKSSYRKWMPITTFCFSSSHDTVCADCCANKTELITTSVTCFEAGRSSMFCEVNTDGGAIQQVRAIHLVQTIKTHRLPLHRLPENNVSGPVGFPCLNQRKVSSDGLFHDVVPAIELFHLCTMTTHWEKESETPNAKSVEGILDFVRTNCVQTFFLICKKKNSSTNMDIFIHPCPDFMMGLMTAEMTVPPPLSAHWR